MNTTTTRRTALAALGMAAFIPTVAVALPLNDRSAWTLAVARYRAATDALTRANAAHSDAEGQYFGSKPARPVFVLEQDGDYGRFGRHVLPLTIDHDELDDPDRVWAEPERVEQFRRTLAGYRSADATLRRELDLDCLEDASVTAMEEQIDAIRHLIALLRRT